MSSLSIKPVSNFARKSAQWVFKALPAFEIPKGKVLNGIKWAGQHISSPQNRLILGVTALMSQPFIDLHNKRVDDETRKVSAARTIAKIVAGTTTGFLVRYYTIKAVDAFTKKPGQAVKTLKSLLFPKGIAHTTIKGMQQYKLALGTYISIGIMLFTNFLIDAPLTKLLTNVLVKKRKERENNINNIQPVAAEKNDKITKDNTFIKRPTIENFTKYGKEHK